MSRHANKLLLFDILSTNVHVLAARWKFKDISDVLKIARKQHLLSYSLIGIVFFATMVRFQAGPCFHDQILISNRRKIKSIYAIKCFI